MKQTRLFFAGTLFLLIPLTTLHSAETSTPELLKVINAVGPEGKGNVEAGKAWKQVVERGSSALIPTLDAMDQADARAQNWLRSAVNAIVQNTLRDEQSLPREELERFLDNKKHAGVSRHLAFEVLTKIDPKTPARYLPKMVNDPGAELRRAAIEMVMKKAESKEDYRELFSASRDHDQVQTLAKKLFEMGVKVDLPGHFGMIQQWHLVAPFDNRKGVGFDTVYPPEKKVDLSATYVGQDEKKISWKSHKGEDKVPEKASQINVGNVGKVDLNEILTPFKGSVAYAHTVVDSPKEQKVELRIACITAIKVWINGKQVFSRNEYHHGMRFDQYVARGTLKKGRNTILLKVCQNEQTEQWAQRWAFQARLCDSVGGAVPFTVTLGK